MVNTTAALGISASLSPFLQGCLLQLWHDLASCCRPRRCCATHMRQECAELPAKRLRGVDEGRRLGQRAWLKPRGARRV